MKPLLRTSLRNQPANAIDVSPSTTSISGFPSTASHDLNFLSRCFHFAAMVLTLGREEEWVDFVVPWLKK
jgi:hypothetical protein